MKEKNYQVIFWKAVQRIVENKVVLKNIIENLKLAYSKKSEGDFWKFSGKLIIEMNNLYTAFLGIERLFPEILNYENYPVFKEKFERLMALIIRGYEKKNVETLWEYIKILESEYFEAGYLYLNVAFRKEGAYVLQ